MKKTPGMIRYGYLDGLDDVDLSLSGLIGSPKQVEQIDHHLSISAIF